MKACSSKKINTDAKHTLFDARCNNLDDKYYYPVDCWSVNR